MLKEGWKWDDKPPFCVRASNGIDGYCEIWGGKVTAKNAPISVILSALARWKTHFCGEG